jgi:hydrogenase nickel incorporation protein HypA/HybF
MHEFSIAKEILDVVEQTIGPRKPVRSVQLILGALSGVSADALRFCFTELAEQAEFGRPDLVIAESLAQVRCRDCGRLYQTADFTEGCPGCGSFNRDILSGYECTVDTITIEEN